MRKKILICMFLLFVFPCFGVSVFAAEAKPAGKTGEAPAIKSQETQVTSGAPEIVVPEKEHHFEPVVEGVDVFHDFIIKNSGTATLEIEKVKTT